MKNDIKYGTNAGVIESVDGIELNEIVWVQFNGPTRQKHQAKVTAFTTVLGEIWVKVAYIDPSMGSDGVRLSRIITDAKAASAEDWEFTPGIANEPVDPILETPNEIPVKALTTGERNIEYRLEYVYSVTDTIIISVPVPDYLDAEGGKSVAYKLANTHNAELRDLASETSRVHENLFVSHIEV